jgi:hypothetical protein
MVINMHNIKLDKNIIPPSINGQVFPAFSILRFLENRRGHVRVTENEKNHWIENLTNFEKNQVLNRFLSQDTTVSSFLQG